MSNDDIARISNMLLSLSEPTGTPTIRVLKGRGSRGSFTFHFDRAFPWADGLTEARDPHTRFFGETDTGTPTDHENPLQSAEGGDKDGTGATGNSTDGISIDWPRIRSPIKGQEIGRTLRQSGRVGADGLRITEYVPDDDDESHEG